MRTFSIFTLVYLAVGAGFAVIAFREPSAQNILAAGFGFIFAICSAFPWWQRARRSQNKARNWVATGIMAVILLAIVIYDWLHHSLGKDALVLSALILTAISLVEVSVTNNTSSNLQGD